MILVRITMSLNRNLPFGDDYRNQQELSSWPKLTSITAMGVVL